MTKKSSLQASKTNFRRLRQMNPGDVKVTPEHPKLDVKEIARAIVRKGLKPVPPKASVSLRIDVDVLEWFKSRGNGYQTRINAVLEPLKRRLSEVIDINGIILFHEKYTQERIIRYISIS
jgi:uncharacterized protein (DUF4415 family)